MLLNLRFTPRRWISRGWLTAFLGCLLSAPAFSQPVASPDLAQGRALLSQLKIAPVSNGLADEEIFRHLGVSQSEKALMAVAANGQTPAATTEDWAEMHRAYDALIELNIGEQQLFKASIYANLQDAAYRNTEEDYVSAVAAARQALDLQQRAGQTATISIPWDNLGQDLIHLGRIGEGVEALYQARKLIQDQTSPLSSEIWSKIISAEWARGNQTLARTESTAFLAAAGPSSPPDFRAGALLAAANLAIDDHRYDDATARVHEALTAIKGAPTEILIGYQALDVLLAMGLEATNSMPYDQAITLCGHLDKDFPALPISISAFVHTIENHRRRLAGQFDIVLREDSAQLERARSANDITAQVSALLSTALDYAYLREATQQAAALKEAADILRTPAADTVPASLRYRVMNSLGAIELADGDLPSARAAYTAVLSGIAAISSAQMRSQLGGLYGDAELGMAAVEEKEGDLQGARKILQQSLAPASGGPGRFTHSTVLLQSARLDQSASQQSSKVIHLYLDAIAALHQEKDVNSEVYARLQLAQYLLEGTHSVADLKGTDSAAAIAREQLDLVRSASASVGLADANWRVEFLEGMLDQSSGNLAAAIKSYAAAVDALNRIRSGLSEPEERQSFIDSAAVQELYRRQIELLTTQGDRDRAWKFLEGDKARSFLESMNGRRFSSSPPKPKASAAKGMVTDLSQLEQQILTARLLLSPANESALRDSGRTPEILDANLVSLESQFALARQEKSLVNSRATQPLSLTPITLAATEMHIPAHTALIEYAILDKELAAFVVTHTSATELHWPADTVALPGQLHTLSVLLSSPRASEDKVDAQLSSASDILLGPVLPTLDPDIETLIIVPTQSISLVPFQALPLPKPTSQSRGFTSENSDSGTLLDDFMPRTLLIDRFTVAYLPSASTLQFLHFGPPSSSPDLFLGAIGGISVDGLPPLPGTLQETAAIQKLYPGAIRETGAAFTHDVAVAALLQHQEVHFATHGLFDSHAPLFSALVTAPAAGQASRLSLYEVMDLNLKARLVILSACETDRGQLSGGDEVEGLTRTFLQAGAENVVSSLWSVNDESTALLMESLHAHLRAGESTPTALRHAELQVRRKFPQPFYWAAFVDTGIR
jgi:CHAT domain-containing protein